MLWRALKHVQNGVYVDVGAQHPVIDSVSKAFYEHGWRGIHIEPVLEYAELLRKDRPDETVLQVALSDTEGTLELNVIPDTGLSTAVDTHAQCHQSERGFEYQKIQVPVLTLKSALKSLVGKDVHWLKIDVEGLEEQVLKGWDSLTLRPWVMVVEATIPNSPEQDYSSWDPILTRADYQFVYFDGLNRFYVAKEHAELEGAFMSPPNVFDDMMLTANSYICRGLVASHQAREKELNHQMGALETELATRSEHTDQREHELTSAREQINALETKTQWLQDGWDASQQRVATLSHQTGALETELATRSEQTVYREHELSVAREQINVLEAKAQWLQNEWDSAKVKVEELNHSSHHWWTVADGFNRELQSVYASKSWQITLPLRKTVLATKWVLALPSRTVRWLLGLPKRIAKTIVLWAVRQTLANQGLKTRALNVLNKHPKLKHHIRLLAMRAGLIANWGTALPASQAAAPNRAAIKTDEPASPLIIETEMPKKLSPRAIHIYAELKRNIEARKS